MLLRAIFAARQSKRKAQVQTGSVRNCTRGTGGSELSAETSQHRWPLLTRMFADADRTMATFRERREELAEKGFRPGSPEFAEATRQAHLAINPETGRLLYLLVRARSARTVVEFGTSFGVSTLHLAAALRDNGHGRLITTELEPTKAATTRRTLTDSGLDDLVEIREGDALVTLAADPIPSIDLLFLDGANHLYVDVLRLLEPALVTNSIVIADNADAPGYRDYIATANRYMSTPVSDRVELSLHLGEA